METENIERIIDKEEDNQPKVEEEEKSINEEEEESEINNDENPQKQDSNLIESRSQENEPEVEEANINEQNPDKETQKEKEKENIDPYSTTTYILKYKRTKEEMKELAVETNLPKSEKYYFMINIKLIKNESADMTNSNTDISNNENITADYLSICCHEIAAVYMDEIYEKNFTLDELCKEVKYFKIFDRIEDARNIIDESMKTNENNPKKIFIDFKNKELKLHMKLSYWDREKETILTVPKKHLNDQEKNNLLPEFLKEIQEKMNHLKDENKKLKAKNLILQNSQGGSDFLIETDFKKEGDVKNAMINEGEESKNEENLENKNVIKKKIVKKKKMKKKIVKEQPKKISANPTEENFF